MWQKNINDFDRVVAIGGGHGMGRVLSSLSFLGQRLTGERGGGVVLPVLHDQPGSAWQA